MARDLTRQPLSIINSKEEITKMKKKTWLRVLESCVFVLLLGAVLAYATRALERKASSNQFGPFLKNPQQYDVLFFGDSRFVNCLFPMELWEDYGIAGYNLSCYGNTMPVTYWSMMNAFDYADPEVAVIAVNGVRKDLKVTGSSSDVHTAFDFFPLTRTKIRAIEDLMDDPNAADDEGNRYVDMKWEYYFTIGKYHSRWNEVSWTDVSGNPNVQKGADMMVGVATAEDYDIIDDNLYAEEVGVGYSYLRRTIEECQSRGVKVLLVHLPYPASENSQMNANTVGSIAEEYGVDYLDLMRMDSVVDYAVDCYDHQAHLNPSGGLKITDFLGQYLRERYGLADHRGEASYENWKQDEQDYAAYKRDLIAQQSKLGSLLVMLHDDSVNASIAVRAHADLYWDDQVLTLVHNVNREHVFEPEAYSKWSNSMFPLDGLEDALWSDEAYFVEFDRKNGAVSEWVGEAAVERAKQTFGDAVWEEDKEIRIRVQDKETGELICERQF